MLIAQALVNGLALAAMYLLIAIGFALVFSIVRVINFAHGEFYMIGGFVLMFAYTGIGLPFGLAVLVSAVVVGLLGVAIQRTVLVSIQNDPLNAMILTLGLAIILQSAMALLVGPDPFGVPSPVTGFVRIGPAILPMSRAVVLGGAIVVLFGFWFCVTRTSLGRAMRALAQDPEVARLQGIPVKRTFSVAFGIGAALAGVAGALMAPVTGLTPYIGAAPMLKAFVIVILGGLGSIFGAAAGGLILGLLDSVLASTVGSAASDLTQLVLVILILLVRPQGLFGRPE